MASTCQVDFYVLQDGSLPAEVYACELALMVWEQGKRVLVLAETQAHAERLDALMWEYPQGRFLPHAQKRQDLAAPVIIGIGSELEDDSADAAINLTGKAVSRPERFHRLLELVPANDTEREASRDKFRVYRGHGLEPKTHPFDKTK